MTPSVNGIGVATGSGYVTTPQASNGPTPAELAALANADPAAIAAMVDSGTGVSPELIVAMTQSRISDTDSQIQHLMDTIDARTKESQRLSEEQRALQNAMDEVSSPDAQRKLQEKLDDIKSQQQKANSGNEIDMIRLQSAMQQRSQIITMASNMLKSIHDTHKSIVNNLR